MLLVDPVTGAVVKELEVEGDQAGLVAFGAGGTRLASASTSQGSAGVRYFLRVWDTATYDVVFERDGHVGYGRVPDFAFSADGGRLAVGSDTDVRVFDLSGGALTLPYPQPESRSSALGPDGGAVVLAAPNGNRIRLEIVDVDTREVLVEFPHAARSGAEWSADGRYLLAGTKLLRADDMGVAGDLAKGHLDGLERQAEPSYVDATTYDVAGTLSIDGGAPIAFSEAVVGNETQRYLAPQTRGPLPATLRLELTGHPWSLVAWQYYGGAGATSGREGAWSGHMRRDPVWRARTRPGGHPCPPRSDRRPVGSTGSGWS